MNTNPITEIDKNIEELIKDKEEHNLSTLKKKIETILSSQNIFIIDGQLDSKAVDLYLKKVITKKNNIKKEQEKNKLANTKKTKYALIEAICKKLEFETQTELIQKVEELEQKTNIELTNVLEQIKADAK